MARQRQRRRAAGAALALTASGTALGTVGLPPAGAGTTAPTTTVTCRVSSSGGETIRIETTGLAPRTTYSTVGVIRPGNFTVDSSGWATDEAGILATPFFGPQPARPFRVAWVVYLDTDGSDRWDPDRDETLYRGDGEITACPSTVTLTPK